MVRLTTFIAGLALLLAGTAQAYVPDRLHYQGYLTNTEGEAVDCPTAEACPDESFTVTFRLYDEAEGGDPLWQETHEAVVIDNGVFNLELGSLSPLDVSLVADPSFIGVEINGSGEMSPRQRVTSSAFSMRSARSEMAETAETADHATIAETADHATMADSADHATVADTATAADNAADSAKLGGYDAVEYALVTELPGLCVTEEALGTKGFMTGEDVAAYLTETGYVTGPHLTLEEVGALISDMTVAGLMCQAGEVAMYDGEVWNCMALVDDDTLRDLSCEAGDVAHYDVETSAWMCGPDMMLTPEQVDDIVSDNGFAMDADLSEVAKTGSFTNLVDVPEGLADGDDNTQLDEAAVDEMVANNGYAMASSVDALAPVASSGKFEDLIEVPAGLADGDDNTQLDEAAVDGMVSNNGYAMDADLAEVAKTGSFTNLTDVPAGLADGDDNTQLDEAAVDGMVSNNGYAMDADLAEVAKTGSFTNLTDVPAGLADGDDNTQLDEAAVDGMVSNNGYAMDSDLAAVAKSGDYADLTGVPDDLGDGDDDTLAGLACTDGQFAYWDDEEGVWACGTDRVLTESEVDGMVGNNGYAMDADFAPVAKTGSFTNLTDVPAGLADGDDDTQLDEAAVDGMVSNNGYAMDADLSEVAKTGSFTNLIDVPAGLVDGDDDTQLTEAEVDGYVSNNGYALASELYTDSEAVAAVATADAYVKNTGDQIDGDLTMVGSMLKAKAENLGTDPDTGAQLTNDVMVYANAPYGTSRLYAGQGTNYGGGIRYDANGVDDVSFFRRSDNVEHEVFRYKHNSDEVIFNGDVSIKGELRSSQSNLVPDAEFLDLTTQQWINTTSIPNAQVTALPDGVTGYAHHVVSDGTGCYEWARSARFQINPNKAYRFSVWIKSNSPTMHNYLGFNVYDADKVKIDHYALEEGAAPCSSDADCGTDYECTNGVCGDEVYANPYFKTSENDANTWTRWTAYLMPHFSERKATKPSHTAINHPATNGQDYVWPEDGRHALIRFGSCYAEVDGEESWFAYPSVVEVSGDSDPQHMGDLDVSGGFEVEGDATFVGAVTLEGETTVDDNLSVNKDLAVLDDVTISDDLVVSSDATVQGVMKVGAVTSEWSLNLGGRGSVNTVDDHFLIAEIDPPEYSLASLKVEICSANRYKLPGCESYDITVSRFTEFEDDEVTINYEYLFYRVERTHISENGCGANTPTPNCTSVGQSGSQHTVLTPRLTWAPRNAAAEVDTDGDGVFDTRPGLRSVKVWIPMNETEPGSSGSYTDAHVTLRGMGEPSTITPTTTQTVCAPSMEDDTDPSYDAYCANLESYVMTLDLTDNADGHRIPAVSCPAGMWGDNCQNTCPGGSGADACNGNGTCSDGPDGTGICTCDAAWLGDACDELAPCGNGVLDSGEDCDDGNTDDGDVCPGNCTISQYRWVTSSGTESVLHSTCGSSKSSNSYGADYGLCRAEVLGKKVAIPVSNPPSGRTWNAAGYSSSGGSASGFSATLSAEDTYLEWFGGSGCGGDTLVSTSVTLYTCIGE